MKSISLRPAAPNPPGWRIRGPIDPPSCSGRATWSLPCQQEGHSRQRPSWTASAYDSPRQAARQVQAAEAPGDGLGQAKRLTRIIKGASSVQELQGVLQSNGEAMNFLHVAAALTRFAHISTPPLQGFGAVSPADHVRHGHARTGSHSAARQQQEAQQLGSTLMGMAHGMLPQLRPRELANMLWAAAKAGCSVDPAWLADFTAAVQAQLDAFNGQDLSSTLWALARLGHRPSSAWMSAFLVQCRSQLARMDAQALSNVMWALATLGHPPSPAWVHDWQVAMESQVMYLTPQGHANAAWGLARMGQPLGRAWASQLRGLLLSNADAFSARELAMLLFALGKAPPSGADLLGRDAVHAAARAALQQVQALSVTEAVWALWGLAQLRHHPGEHLLAQLLHHTQPRLHQADARTLANAAWALQRLQQLVSKASSGSAQWAPQERVSGRGLAAWGAGAVDAAASHAPALPQLLPAWLDACLEATQQHLHHMDAHSCAMLAHSLSQLQARPSADWLLDFLSATEQLLDPQGQQQQQQGRQRVVRPVELMCVAYALARWHAVPGAAWADGFMRSFARTLPQSSPKEACNTVLALAHLGLAPPHRLLLALGQAASSGRATLSDRDVQQLRRAAALLPELQQGLQWVLEAEGAGLQGVGQAAEQGIQSADSSAAVAMGEAQGARRRGSRSAGQQSVGMAGGQHEEEWEHSWDSGWVMAWA